MKLIHIFLNIKFKILNKVRKGANMKPKRYPYSGQKKKESTFKTIDVMIDGNGSVEFIRNNRLAQIYSLERIL